MNAKPKPFKTTGEIVGMQRMTRGEARQLTVIINETTDVKYRGLEGPVELVLRPLNPKFVAQKGGSRG